MRSRVVATVVLIGLALTARAMDRAAVDSWSSDLRFVRETVPAKHAEAFHTISAERFGVMLDALEHGLPGMTKPEAVVALAEVIAAIGDGHTRLAVPLASGVEFFQGHSTTKPPADSSLLFHAYPLRLGIYQEGVFVERIEPKWSAYAGARLMAIDGHPIAEILTALEPAIRHDNREQLLDLEPEFLVLAELLVAKGIVADPEHATFQVETIDGRKAGLVLAPQADGESIAWANARPDVAVRPLAFRYLEGPTPMTGLMTKNYWFEWLPRSRTVYLQVAESVDDGDESLFDFARRLRETLGNLPAENLVVDLRWNRGGDNALNRPLLHAIIASESVNRPGHLFVLVGRRTFSAAMMLAVDLEKHTHAVFVGEPTGSSPNHYGDSRKVVLPETGLTLRLSSLDWQYSDPRDRRDAIAPQIPTPPRWGDWRAGFDAALDAIVAPEAQAASLDGTWHGVMAPPFDEFPIRLVVDGDGGTLDAKPIGGALRVDRIRLNGDAVRFDAKSDAGALQFEGRLLGRRIAGEIVLGDRRESAFPFALELGK